MHLFILLLLPFFLLDWIALLCVPFRTLLYLFPTLALLRLSIHPLPLPFRVFAPSPSVSIAPTWTVLLSHTQRVQDGD